MRRAARTDANQSRIVETFRACGWSVLDLSGHGGGVHDLLIGRPGINVLIECKDGNKETQRRKLSPAQIKFHAAWAGPQDICTSIDEAHRISVFWWERATGFHRINIRDRANEAIVPRGTNQSSAFTLKVYS